MATDKSTLFLRAWQVLRGQHGMDNPQAEYRFHPVRKWRFDWAFPEQKIAIEVEGNAWNVSGGGRHMQDTDLEKYNNAAALGWRVFRFSPSMLKRDPMACVMIVAETLGVLE